MVQYISREGYSMTFNRTQKPSTGEDTGYIIMDNFGTVLMEIKGDPTVPDTVHIVNYHYGGPMKHTVKYLDGYVTSVTCISCPNQIRYEFEYNVYGYMTKVSYPTGLKEEITWAALEETGATQVVKQVSRRNIGKHKEAQHSDATSVDDDITDYDFNPEGTGHNFEVCLELYGGYS